MKSVAIARGVLGRDILRLVMITAFVALGLQPTGAYAQGAVVSPTGCGRLAGGIMAAGSSCGTREQDDKAAEIPHIDFQPDGGAPDNQPITKGECFSFGDNIILKDGFGRDRCVPKHCQTAGTLSVIGAGSDCSGYPIRTDRAGDPNDKTGSRGATVSRFLARGTPLRYAIFFENLENFTGAAQEVVITDQLDAARMDLGTLSLGPISFGTLTVLPLAGQNRYTTEVDYRPAKDMIVRIEARLDEAMGVLTWRFTSIDPATGILHEDPLAGFLPPNKNPPEGEGSVVFTVDPMPGLATGTEIRNQARIVFDVNPPIDTPAWLNTIDISKPQSAVLPLPASQAATAFDVLWSGTDTGSGISDYSIFVSENGGPYSPLASTTVATSVPFTGQVGKTYRFYSVARDQVGNVEDPPAVPDATTTIGALTCAVNVSAQVGVTRGGYRRNSSTGRYLQIVTLRNNGATSVQGPVSLVLDGLSANAALFNRSGITGCAAPSSPLRSVSVGADNIFAPGESALVTLEFTNPSNLTITYRTRVLAGSPQ